MGALVVGFWAATAAAQTVDGDTLKQGGVTYRLCRRAIRREVAPYTVQTVLRGNNTEHSDKTPVEMTMTREKWRQFFEAMNQCADAGDKMGMEVLCDPVREAATFGGVDVLKYWQACLLVGG